MDPDFWHARWQADGIGFHEGQANDLLVRHLPALGLKPGARILVPLCGKAQDLPWLAARGFAVIGVELSMKAVTQLYAEMAATPQIERAGALTRYEARGVTVYAGDIFALDAETLGPVDAVYDRAATVALPAGMRERYAAKLAELAAGAPRLLITFAYDQSLAEGPPFSVDAAEVARLYGAATLLEKREVEGGLKGRIPASEAAWLIG